MSLFIASLNSGSNGNCYYIGNDHEAVLIDAGISCRETEQRMARLGLSMHLVKAVFITHEHSDHIKGLCRLVSKYELPVFITPATLENSKLGLPPHLIHTFKAGISITVGALSILAFRKCHDAIDPHSFIIRQGNKTVGVITDIGDVCHQVIDHFKICDAVFLESNYDEDLLHQGRYPYFLKRRISGGQGHLSNRQALDLFRKHRSKTLNYLFLSHLSKDNNCPDLAVGLFNRYAGKTEVILASRYGETALYRLDTDTTSDRPSLPQQISLVF